MVGSELMTATNRDLVWFATQPTISITWMGGRKTHSFVEDFCSKEVTTQMTLSDLLFSKVELLSSTPRPEVYIESNILRDVGRVNAK